MSRATFWLSSLRTATAMLALLLSLGFVVWRQARSLETLAQLDRVRSRQLLLAAELAELDRRTQMLESRAWVVPQAERRLGLRAPQADEIVILPAVNL